MNMKWKSANLQAILVAAGIALAPIAVSADVKDGVDAWSRGDYSEAIREWQAMADKGDPDAQFNLAQAYKLGKGVEQDLDRAEALYGEAAAHGHVRAADNYGLLLFQRGDRAKAMPYILSAADRGEPPAQYILGLAFFNGDNVTKDWVRAYALISLARQAGLQQATSAMAQMDSYIPLEQRQQGVALAADLATQAEAARKRLALAEGLEGNPVTAPPPASTLSTAPASARVAAAPEIAGPEIARAPAPALTPFTPAPPPPARTTAPVVTNAPVVPPPAPKPVAEPAPAPKPAAKPAPAPKLAPKPAPKPKPAASPSGHWRVQLGAFGVAGNADRLWARVKNRPELAGHPQLKVPAGKLTKLQAGGFASSSEAQAACRKLKAAGFACLPVRN